MSEATIAFCVLLDGLADAPDYTISDVNDFYDAASEYSRLTQSLSETPEFTDAEKECIQRSFPIAIQRASEVTNELMQSKNSSEELQNLIFNIEAVTNDLFNAYKIATNGEVPSEVNDSILKLQSEHDNIQQQL